MLPRKPTPIPNPLVLRVVSVTKQYGGKKAVHNVSFEVGAGEIVGLLGPNGAGKTTMMNLIAGLVRPTAGTIEIEGHDVFREPIQAKQARFFVPDTPALFGHDRRRIPPLCRCGLRNSRRGTGQPDGTVCPGIPLGGSS
ncbi:ATP-binding cassette domain-containing protein [Calditerricola satsumensis]|uniref:ATP-binding cassette domain-containing protein n=1 Tax=Calditerricola satsumensis TaxID=373054 RepID=UPI0009FB5760|nr:ATP-binding cassette domain-containing protein [Calditerricola satsumensis]